MILIGLLHISSIEYFYLISNYCKMAVKKADSQIDVISTAIFGNVPFVQAQIISASKINAIGLKYSEPR